MGPYVAQAPTQYEGSKAGEALEPWRAIDLDSGVYADAYAPGIRYGIVQRRVAADENVNCAVDGTLAAESGAATGINSLDNGVGAEPRYIRDPAGTDKYLKLVTDGRFDVATTGETAIAVALDGQWAAPTSDGIQLLEIAFLKEAFVVP